VNMSAYSPVPQVNHKWPITDLLSIRVEMHSSHGMTRICISLPYDGNVFQVKRACICRCGELPYW
jgi:hypothetical protein